MKKGASIQETLLNIGFIINGENFVRHDIVIPFDEIIGYSVDSFLEKAKRRGWIQEDQRGGGGEKSMLLEPGVIWSSPQTNGTIDYKNFTIVAKYTSVNPYCVILSKLYDLKID